MLFLDNVKGKHCHEWWIMWNSKTTISENFNNAIIESAATDIEITKNWQWGLVAFASSSISSNFIVCCGWPQRPEQFSHCFLELGWNIFEAKSHDSCWNKDSNIGPEQFYHCFLEQGRNIFELGNVGIFIPILESLLLGSAATDNEVG